MDSHVQDASALEIARLEQEESRLERETRAMEAGLSGLKDIDLILALARTRLSLCILLVERAQRDAHGRDAEISDKALSAMRLVEGLAAENISEDQKGIIQKNPLFAEFSKTLQQFIMAGGGGFLSGRGLDERKTRILSRCVVAAIRRHMGDDDRSPAMDIEGLPRFLGRALRTVFPIMVKEHPQKPPYGIEEGEQVVYSSKNIQLPLSQAIFYLSNDLLPTLERRLAESPGNAAVQEEIQNIQERIEDYEKMRFFPRSTPVLLEKGYYTEGMTGYTSDGEMLVPVPLAVSFDSGTNLDRKMELVRMDVVKEVAGRGISPGIDGEYRRLKSLSSGIHGSSRQASQKLDAASGYRALRQEYPFLARLSDKAGFLELLGMVRSGSLAASASRVEALIEKEQSGGSEPPDFIGISRSDPS